MSGRRAHADRVRRSGGVSSIPPLIDPRIDPFAVTTARYTGDARIPCASVAPGRVHFYDMPVHWYTGDRVARRGMSVMPRKEPDAERAARRARRRAIEAAGWLWLRSKGSWLRDGRGSDHFFRQAFWTFTIPEPMPEQAAREAFSAWWTWARNVAQVRSYLWVAELTKRGRVHFHALVNQWIDIAPASDAWLRALKRQGVGSKLLKAPAALCEVEAVKSAGKARGYVTKYIGKDFGTRKDQLVERIVKVHREADGHTPDMVPELRARLVDSLARPSVGKRRWAATEDIERDPIQVIGAEQPGELRQLVKELTMLPGTHWGNDGDNGRPCFYSLDSVDRERAPVLFSLLHQ